MLPPGTLLQQRYRILRQLKQGGMGTVYEATDERLDSTVALKECHFTEEPLRRQFEREARLLARLRHPALTKVIDHFSEASGQFLVMEFIPGEDLSEMIVQRNGPFPQSDVLVWADQLLDALDYLHTHDPPIVHRDIKPQNLKRTARGQVILLDFGLAKGFADQRSRITSSGSIFGYTPNYAPLEQIQGTGTDPRSDLYSLAATLFHLLTATAPPDALTRITAVANDQPDALVSAHDINPLVSPAVSDILRQAMSQNRGKRPPTASHMRQMLRDAGGTQPQFGAGSASATIVEPQAVVVPQPTHIDAPPTHAPTPPPSKVPTPPAAPAPEVTPVKQEPSASPHTAAETMPKTINAPPRARDTGAGERKRPDTTPHFLDTYAEPEPSSRGGFKVWWLAVPAALLLAVVASAFYLFSSNRRPAGVDVTVKYPADNSAGAVNNSTATNLGHTGTTVKGNSAAVLPTNTTPPKPTPTPKATPTPMQKPTPELTTAKEKPALIIQQPPPAPEKKSIISGGVLNGRAISKPQPPYPAIAKAARASGTVTVQVTVDESGRVVSASPVSGHPLLQQAAVQAARNARFSPTLLGGQPVKVTGVMTYNFVLQ